RLQQRFSCFRSHSDARCRPPPLNRSTGPARISPWPDEALSTFAPTCSHARAQPLEPCAALAQSCQVPGGRLDRYPWRDVLLLKRPPPSDIDIFFWREEQAAALILPLKMSARYRLERCALEFNCGAISDSALEARRA